MVLLRVGRREIRVPSSRGEGQIEDGVCSGGPGQAEEKHFSATLVNVLQCLHGEDEGFTC